MKKKKYLYNLCPTFVDIFKNNYDISIYLKRHEKRVKRAKKLLSNFYKYFFTSLHDCPVNSINFNDNYLDIELDDFMLNSFFDALKQKDAELNNENNNLFPLKINFEKLKSFNLYHINNNLLIKPMKLDFLSQISTLLYYEIISVNLNEINIGFLFWLEKKYYKSKYVLMIVKASKINILEMQKEKWQKYTNNKYDTLYNNFEKERFLGRYFDYSSSLKFIDNFTENISYYQ